MNNIIKHIVMVSLALTYVACSDNYEDDLATSGGEGSISFNIALPESASTRSDNVSSALDQSVLKIYDADNRLVRRYEPVTEMPESIYILAGNYTATLLVGDETTATLDWSELSYYGEVGFTVTDEMNSSVTLSCPTQNSLVEVSFDSSIDNVFKEGYQVSIYNAENQEDATKSLTLTTSGTAYFLLDEEETLWWDFSGEKLNDSQESASGKIEGLQATQLYTLSFKYSTYLEVSTMSVVIDDSLETYNDLLLFAPQPQITAITEEYSSEVNKYYTDDIQFSVSSLSEIVRVEVITDDITTAISVGGDEVDGLSYVAEDDCNGTITISPSIYKNFTYGGEQDATLRVIDSNASAGKVTIPLLVSGFEVAPTVDLWLMNSSVVAKVYGSAESVVVEYRMSGESDWSSINATSVGNNSYSATIEADWSENTNGNGYKIYTPSRGFVPSSEYEYRLLIDGEEYSTHSLSTDSANQTILDADMPSTLSAFLENKSSSSTSWASGNNSFVNDDVYLCSYATYGGVGCAKLDSHDAGALGVDKFAAGNIFYGQFSFSNFTGTVSFGQPFTWSAKPRSLKLNYAASLGTLGSDYSDSDILASGSTDKALVYVAIVDWSSRHQVKAGTSSTTGIWSPEDPSTASEGDIIGYGLTYITKSTTSSSLEPLEIEIHYYDKVTKPSNDISLVINCTPSAYGDYFVGSMNSVLYVRDFEFGY